MRLAGAPAAQELYIQTAREFSHASNPLLLVLRQESDLGATGYLSMIRRNCAAHGIGLLEGDMEDAQALKTPGLSGCIAISRGEVSIPPSLDVDGAGWESCYSLYKGELAFNTPCTAEACLRLLDYYRIPLAGQHVVILGRSLRVGKPLSLLLSERDATVTLCHSKSRNLQALTSMGDILVCAAGVPGLITKEHVRPGQTVINVGGDALEEEIAPIVENLAPNRGGVGPLTTAVLLRHVCMNAK